MLTPFQQRLLTLKIETTEGTDAAPAAATDSVQVMDLAMRVEAETLDRNLDRTTFGGRPAALIRKVGIATGTVELVGASGVGTAAPISALLRACGHFQTLVSDTPGPGSATYTPLSSSIPSATVYGFHAGERYRYTGARGMLSELLFEIDNYPRATFELRGNPLAMTEAALPTTADFTAFQVPPVIVADNSVMTIDGFNVDGRSLAIRPSVAMGLIHHTEGRVARHTDRLTEATLRFFRSTYTEKNIHSIANSETPVAISFTVTTTAGKNITVTLPRVQLLLPTPTEIDGMFAWEVTARVLPNAGDDEYSIAFT
jgi:hypothetical protein